MIPGLRTWYDAADSGSITTATGVTTLLDKSGNGVHQSQATGSQQPAYTNTINGLRVLTFDGADDEMTASANSAINLSSMTMFAVFQSLDVRNAGVVSKIGISTTPDGFGIYTRTPAAVWFQVDAATGAIASKSTSTASPSIVTAYNTGGNAWMAVNNIAPAVGTTLCANSVNLPLHLGKRYSTSEYWYGHLCEVLIYNGVLSGYARNEINRYLQNKWAVTPYYTAESTNQDAQDWIDRVYANSGTVSVPVAAAATTLGNGLVSASVRDRFYRLGILAGDQLAASLIPFLRGPAFGGQVYGAVSDTGVNLVNGDYTLATGITGNESTKYFRSGAMTSVKPSWATVCYGIDVSSAAYTGTQKHHCGSFFNESPTAPRGWYVMYGSTSSRSGFAGVQSRNSHTSGAGLKLTDRASSTDLRVYENGVQVGTTNTASDTSSVVPASDFCVMASGYQNVSAGTPTTTVNGYAPIAGACRGYIVAETMTPTQHADLYALWAAFKTAIGRT
jgi:hypothetical protein